MAYSPTTWNTNDVITKDKLNKIEQGIVSASKLSGTDIDTDKDWNGKSITNVGSLTSHGETIINTSGEFAGGGAAYIYYADPQCNPANVCAQNLNSFSKSYPGYAKGLVLPEVPSTALGDQHTVQAQWQHRVGWNADGSQAVRSKIYVNDVAVGVEKIGISTGYVTVSDTIPVKPGDIISLWVSGAGGGEYGSIYGFIQNLKIFAFAVPAARPTMW